MLLKLTLGQDNGAEVTSLVIPLPSNYLQLSNEQLAGECLTPYLHELRLAQALWLDYLEGRAGVMTRNKFGPV